MREIKFRAWNIKNKRMYPSASIWKCDFREYNTGDFIILQYTGIKDKNGKEIYEGDIVLISKTKYVIEWSTMSAGFILIQNGKYYDNLRNRINLFFKYEIIGNIHENKDLLDAK